MALYSKNQVHRGHPQTAKGRLSSRLTPRKMPASSSARRSGPRSEIRRITPSTSTGKNLVHTATDRAATARRCRPPAQSQRKDAEQVPVERAVDEQRRRRCPDPRLGPRKRGDEPEREESAPRQEGKREREIPDPVRGNHAG